jgi:ABC-type polysaccharide/polyol phosphate transport system ATPase subunit
MKNAKANILSIKIMKLANKYDEIKLDSKQEVIDVFINFIHSKYEEFHMSNMNSSEIVITAFQNISLDIYSYECFRIFGHNNSSESSKNIYYDDINSTERKGKLNYPKLLFS